MYLAMDEEKYQMAVVAPLVMLYWCITYRIIKNCRKQRRRKNCSGSTASNDSAIRLYERNGLYSVVCAKDFMNFPKEDAYVMVL